MSFWLFVLRYLPFRTCCLMIYTLFLYHRRLQQIFGVGLSLLLRLLSSWSLSSGRPVLNRWGLNCFASSPSLVFRSCVYTVASSTVFKKRFSDLTDLKLPFKGLLTWHGCIAYCRLFVQLISLWPFLVSLVSTAPSLKQARSPIAYRSIAWLIFGDILARIRMSSSAWVLLGYGMIREHWKCLILTGDHSSLFYPFRPYILTTVSLAGYAHQTLSASYDGHCDGSVQAKWMRAIL